MQASGNFVIKFTRNYLKMWDRCLGFEFIVYLIEAFKYVSPIPNVHIYSNPIEQDNQPHYTLFHCY